MQCHMPGCSFNVVSWEGLVYIMLLTCKEIVQSPQKQLSCRMHSIANHIMVCTLRMLADQDAAGVLLTWVVI